MTTHSSHSLHLTCLSNHNLQPSIQCQVMECTACLAISFQSYHNLHSSTFNHITTTHPFMQLSQPSLIHPLSLLTKPSLTLSPHVFSISSQPSLTHPIPMHHNLHSLIFTLPTFYPHPCCIPSQLLYTYHCSISSHHNLHLHIHYLTMTFTHPATPDLIITFTHASMLNLITPFTQPRFNLITTATHPSRLIKHMTTLIYPCSTLF